LLQIPLCEVILVTALSASLPIEDELALVRDLLPAPARLEIEPAGAAALVGVAAAAGGCGSTAELLAWAMRGATGGSDAGRDDVLEKEHCADAEVIRDLDRAGAAFGSINDARMEPVEPPADDVASGAADGGAASAAKAAAAVAAAAPGAGLPRASVIDPENRLVVRELREVHLFNRPLAERERRFGETGLALGTEVRLVPVSIGIALAQAVYARYSLSRADGAPLPKPITVTAAIAVAPPLRTDAGVADQVVAAWIDVPRDVAESSVLVATVADVPRHEIVDFVSTAGKSKK
jgi:hypothetical protein